MKDERVILHCDLNSFYASVECLYDPSVRELPVVVSGDQSLRHGIVLAKNQIAKKMGITTGEPIVKARQKCPDLVVKGANYDRYIDFSQQTRDIYSRYTNLVECFGIDECWLDLTESCKLFGSGEKIAEKIRQTVKEEMGITISIGVSFNKIFAKLGSDMKKPDAITVINKENFKEKVWPLPASDLLFVGRSVAKRLRAAGIYTIGQLANIPMKVATNVLGKWGEILWIYANGLDTDPVKPIGVRETIKGIGNSMTTPRDLCNNEDVLMTFYLLAESVGKRLREQGFKASTLQISIRSTELEWITRQKGLQVPTFLSGELAEESFKLFKLNWDWHSKIRALGIRGTNLVDADYCRQISLLGDDKKELKKEAIEESVDEIRKRFGYSAIKRGCMCNADIDDENIIGETPMYKVSFFKG